MNSRERQRLDRYITGNWGEDQLRGTRVERFEVSYRGVDSPQYFPGVGIAGTDWDQVALGVGDTPAEAYEDAVEQLAQQFDVSVIPENCPSAEQLGVQMCGCEACTESISRHGMQHYIAVFVKLNQ